VVGGGYDLIARLLATHIGKRIPGNPKFVVENMPGAASLTMTNYLYNRAERDGSAMGLPLNGLLLEPTLKLLSRQGGATNFDIRNMNWIGSTSEEPQVLWFKSDSKIMSIADLKTTKAIAGASSPGADNYTVAKMTNALLGTKMEIVSGYRGTHPIFLAAERGEVEGSATAYAAIAVARPQWIKERTIRMLIQYGTERLPDLPDVPTAIELAESDEVRQMLRFFSLKFKATYPFAMPPDVPAERVKAMRTAFDETIKDPNFLADMKKRGLSPRPMSGVAIANLIRETFEVPEQIVARLHDVITK
jgi:tripartite-type tricarboxylate transporter receptor subunit TctC